MGLVVVPRVLVVELLLPLRREDWGVERPAIIRLAIWCAVLPRLCTSCGQTVRVFTRPGRRLLCLTFAPVHRGAPATRREVGGSSVHLVSRWGELLSRSVVVAHREGRLATGAFTLEKRSRAREKISSRISRIGGISAGALRRDTKL